MSFANDTGETRASGAAEGGDSVSPPDTPPVTEEPAGSGVRRAWRRRRLAAALVVIGVVAAVGAVGTAMAFRGGAPDRTRVLGVDVGGMSRAAASRLLEQRLADRVRSAVPVRVGEAQAEIAPAEVGLTLDFAATAAAADRVRPNPVSALFGSRDVEPVVTVDVEKLAAALQRHVGAQGEPPTNPAIRYEGLTPVPAYPAAGRGVDPGRAADIVRRTWLRRPTIQVPIVEVLPVTTRAEVDRLVSELAGPAVSAPVTVAVGDREFQIPPAAIAASLHMESDNVGRIVPRVDAVKLRQALAEPLKTIEKPGKDATITINNGQPVVTPHVDGQIVDLATMSRDLLPVLRQPAPRRVTGVMTAGPPALTTDAAGALGVKEKISSFTTNFTPGQSRNTNIRLVADIVRGTLLKPGATFSLNAATGDRTLAKGYVPAPVIDGSGRLSNAPGGGISQFATTLFNGAYYAGLEDVTHRPHTYYFSRYPAVIEATTVYPSLDLKFRNDSPHGVLIDTSYTDTSLTVTMWGTKRYEVETVYGPRTGTVAPRTVYVDEPDCIATAGIPGFQQEAWRVFKQAGQEVRRQRFFWRYDAEPRFICGRP